MTKRESRKQRSNLPAMQRSLLSNKKSAREESLFLPTPLFQFSA
ncbi:hypothetical protein [Porphyromonas pogonae]|nr:hypothetical protein [Porphyromonas pogonae]